MHFPEELYYTREHEWLRPLDGGEALVGITDYAQSQLGDIVYVDVPTVGQLVEAGQPFGSVEAVKTVSDLYMPVTGTILEKNPALDSSPEKINQAPYEEGWIVRIQIQNPAQIENLLRASAYQELIA